MRFISTKSHSVLDYLVGVLLIAAPWILNFDTGGPEQTVPVVLGVVAIVMSFFTDYEGGVVRKIPMPVHLSVDLVSGVFLALSPWLLNFADVVFLPHLLVGILEIAVSLMTVKTPYVPVMHRH